MTDVMSDRATFELFRHRFDALGANVGAFVRGKPDVVRLCLVGLFAEGHVLIEDVPGVAKTSLARAIGRSISGRVNRIQFTPDLMPADVTGIRMYDLETRQFRFEPGPVFTSILIADEINRASPKTQSALLEVMAERRVTVAGTSYAINPPFICIATQNPVEMYGTYPLPEAQLDRFMMRIGIGYPSEDDEIEVVSGGLDRQTPEQLEPVMGISTLLEMMSVVRDIFVSPELRAYIVRIVRATRTMSEVRNGASPRGSVALALCAQAYAASSGRAYATADDVKAVAGPVLSHRIILRNDAVADGAESGDLVRRLLTRIQPPRERQRHI